MLEWVVRAARGIPVLGDAPSGTPESSLVVVLGHGREEVATALKAFAPDAAIAIQAEQRGTADAVRAGLEQVPADAKRVLILYGDCPLIPQDALVALNEGAASSPLALLVGTLDEPRGYGRILRDASGAVVGVREERDCSVKERAVREVNPGIYSVEAGFLREAVSSLSSANAQGEFYLTDIVARATALGGASDVAWSMDDLRGINDRFELAMSESRLRARLVRAHAVRGVTFRDPSTAYVESSVLIHPDVVIESSVTLRGSTEIKSRARIDVGAVLTDVLVDEDANVKPYTVAERSRIGVRAHVGPFSHLRPDSELGPDVHIGNFVETKKTKLGRGSKANHLAYLGDGVIGEDVNVGAGTIFCNYDGFQKHTTTLEDGAFIGSDSQLVAPVRVGKGAYVGTGTTVTRDVPDDALAISRTRQENKDGYASRLRARFKAAKSSKGE